MGNVLQITMQKNTENINFVVRYVLKVKTEIANFRRKLYADSIVIDKKSIYSRCEHIYALSSVI